MNKTITINLAGLIFHIDDNAYEVLRNYLDRLKSHFTGLQGNEVLTDIESRIAEIFSSKINTYRKVIVLEDVQEVIDTMGTPEDIAGASIPAEPAAASHAFRKRVYRNPDDKVLGGVCSGIAAYFDIDPIWLRLLFVCGFIFGGTGLLLYIILWIIIPEAKTISEKMAMRGEAITVSNIQKKVQSEMKEVGLQFKNLETKFENQWQNKWKGRTGQAANTVGQGLKKVGGVALLILGMIISFISLVILVGLVALVMVFAGWFPSEEFPAQHLSYFVEVQQLWLVLVGVLLVIGVPVLVLLLNGVKLMFNLDLSLKKTGAIMLMLWFAGIAICIWQGIEIGSYFKDKAVVSNTEKLMIDSTGVINLRGTQVIEGRAEYYDYRRGIHLTFDDRMFQFTRDNVWCAAVSLDIDQSRNDSVYLISTLASRGASTAQARSLARAIGYHYDVKGDEVVFDNAFLLNENRYRLQQVSLTLKIPVGMKVRLDRSLQILVKDAESSTIVDEEMLGHTWLMTSHGLECIDCLPHEKQREIIIPEDQST